GLTYEFGPEGATFEPPITITFTFVPAELPEGVSEEDLFVAVWDEDAGAWVEVEGAIIDLVTGTVTIQVGHFSKYAVFVRVEPVPVPTVISAPPEPAEPVVEEPVVEEPVVEPVVEEPVVEEPVVEEPVVVEPKVEEPVVVEPVVEEGVNWSVLGGIIGGVVVLAAAFYFFWWRRRAYD
ncbi:MAG: hypothetical protein V3R87_00045, partial [Dehalococcoidia bacterium]